MRKLKLLIIAVSVLALGILLIGCGLGKTASLIKQAADELETLDVDDIFDETTNRQETTTTVDTSTLEYYLISNGKWFEIQDQMDEIQKQYSDTYSYMTFECNGNDFAYVYWYVSAYDAVTYEDLEGIFTDSEIDEQKQNFANEYGMKPDTLAYRYCRSDGTLVREFKH